MWEPRKLQYFLPNARIITYTWSMIKKSNGMYRYRLTARGYEKVEELHYYTSNIALPVKNYMSIHIFMVLMLMDGCIVNILNVKVAFLHSEFDEG